MFTTYSLSLPLEKKLCLSFDQSLQQHNSIHGWRRHYVGNIFVKKEVSCWVSLFFEVMKKNLFWSKRNKSKKQKPNNYAKMRVSEPCKYESMSVNICLRAGQNVWEKKKREKKYENWTCKNSCHFLNRGLPGKKRPDSMEVKKCWTDRNSFGIKETLSRGKRKITIWKFRMKKTKLKAITFIQHFFLRIKKYKYW